MECVHCEREKGIWLPMGFWLTVNRECNLRCKWCYAKGSGYVNKTMDLSMAQNITSFMGQHGAQTVMILGGEPTLYEGLGDLLSFAKGLGLRSIVVTNGIKLSDQGYVEYLIEKGVDVVAVSLKASSEKRYRDLVGRDGFKKTIKGINNLVKSGIEVGTSVVLSRQVAGEIFEMYRALDGAGATGSILTSCVPTINCLGISGDDTLNPREAAEAMIKARDAISVLRINVAFELTIPFCLFPQEFIEGLKEDGLLYSGCQLIRREGVIFDLDGSILVCNNLASFPVGKFGDSFHDSDTYRHFWNSEGMNSIYRGFHRYPVANCEFCEQWSECCGGCPLKWTYYDPTEYIKSKIR